MPEWLRLNINKDHGVLKKRRGVWSKTSRRFYKTLGDIFYFRTLAIISFRQLEKRKILENHCHGCQYILNLLIFNIFLWQPMTTRKRVCCQLKLLIHKHLTFLWQPWQRNSYLNKISTNSKKKIIISLTLMYEKIKI